MNGLMNQSELKVAIALARKHCPLPDVKKGLDPSTILYIDVLYGDKGVSIKLQRVLEQMQSWQGEMADEIKYVFNKYSR